MKRLVGLFILATATPASAAILEFHASARAGAATGSGIGGAQKDNDFFEGARGGTFGAVVGIEVMWIDLFVEHDQFTDFSSVNGTWTQFMIGPHFAFPLNEGKPGETAKLYADLGLAAGYGVGTGQQIDPPLDNSEISDKGIMLELKVGLEYRLNRFIGLGLTFPMAWGYMVKNDIPINETDGHYHTFHAMALGTLNLHLGL